jgi:hypothetical protein
MSLPTPLPTIVHLGPRDAVAERPFTAPENSHVDLEILETMRARLCRTLDTRAGANVVSDPAEMHIQFVHEDDQHMHRMVILDRAALRADTELAFVGFFGQRRGDASPALLQDLDTELIQEFLQHHYVLSYSSLELPDGNWANMVILEHIDGIQHWRASQRHAYAARELAPLYYTAIRLHNGALHGGLASPRMVLNSTKYYDFSSTAWWQAIREAKDNS